jgi:hypothetical protein
VPGRPELEVGWEHARESEAVARSRESYGGGSESDGRKKKGDKQDTQVACDLIGSRT